MASYNRLQRKKALCKEDFMKGDERLVARLLAARRAGRAVEQPPQGMQLEEAYRLQKLAAVTSGKQPVGYKLGATSQKAQAFLQLEGPFYGRLFQESCHRDGVSLPADDFIFRLIEPEFALVLGQDLPPREEAYAEDEVAEAVQAVRPAFEIVCSAYGSPAWTTAGAPALIADNGAHGALVLGEETKGWNLTALQGLAQAEVTLSVDGKDIGSGAGAQALGGPLLALTWLANELRHGPGLKAGEIVSTGVVTPFLELAAGQEALADFGSLGRLKVSFV
ncbi:2-keto-4-pentenoate hydratase [Rhodovibrionaceae bacterium A322]